MLVCRRTDGHPSSSRPDSYHRDGRPRTDRSRSDGRSRDERARDREREALRQERAAHLGRLTEFLPAELLSADVLGHMDVDLEELMLMEGIWLSLQVRLRQPGPTGAGRERCPAVKHRCLLSRPHLASPP